jgi:ABC-type dipeptide/oligopeptide/nickel transport system ATPase component
MRQRAVIAMATVNEPDVVVADEPTTALDAEFQDQVLRVLGEQREAVGAALVLGVGSALATLVLAAGMAVRETWTMRRLERV